MALLSSSGLTSTPSKSTVTGPSDYTKPLVNDVLSKGQAIVNNPAPAYTGQLTAGPSNLQNQAWQGLSNLTLPETMTTAGNALTDIGQQAQGVSYNPVGSAFDANQAQQYMNPYLQAALNPQLEAARRSSEISQQTANANAASKGAFGGGRQAIMDAEAARNLNTNLANITGMGYNAAYDKAATQFNADQARRIQEAQFGSDTGLKGLQAATAANQAAGNVGAQQAQYGLQNLQTLATAGNTQQAQDQAALNAQYNQYLDQRSQPFTNLSNQANLIKGLGGSSNQEYMAEQSALQKTAGIAGLGASITKNLQAAGLSSDAIANVLKTMNLGSNPATGSQAGLNYPIDYATQGGQNVADNTLTYDPNSPTFYRNNAGQVVDGNGNVISEGNSSGYSTDEYEYTGF